MVLRKVGLWRGLTFVFTIFLSIGIIAGLVLEMFRGQIDDFLGTRSEVIITTDDGTLYTSFTPSADVLNDDGTGNSQKLIKKFIEFGRRQGADSAVLLKNNNALPLATGSKVTLLGNRSHVTLQGASFGMPIVGPVITLEEALSETKTDFNNAKNDAASRNQAWSNLSNYDFVDVGGAGAGYILNPVMIDVYEEYVTNYNTGKNASNSISYRGPRQGSSKYNPLEPSIADLAAINSEYASSFAQYNDAAIVVVGRPSGESNDYGIGGIAEGLGATEPLELTKNERDIIKTATDNFEKVIVLVNTTSAMEIDELKENSSIDAIVWIGHPGNYGTLGVADLLTGKVNPNGALSDVYAAKNLSHPGTSNIGDFTFENSDEIIRRRSNKYTIEPESIYVGYRYYETRYNDCVYGIGNANSTAGAVASTGNWKYTDEMTYGFGYGLSYSTFKQELVGEPEINIAPHSITMDFKVKVTNTTGPKGKSIVQIYGQAPYKTGGVEKSAIQLLAYDKTKELAKDESQTLTIKVDLQNIASYDNTVVNSDGTKGTYILDEGNYYFALGNGAHDALNNVLAKQGKTTTDGMDYNGVSAKTFQWNYDYKGTGTVDNTTFSVSKANVQVSNQLDYADWNHFEGATPVTYLSRSNWKDTYPITYKDITAPASMLDLLNGKYYEIKTNDDTSDITFGDSNIETKFSDMKLSDYDDPRWDDLMDKITLEDAMGVIACNGNGFRELKSVEFLGGLTLTENSGNGVAKDITESNYPDAPWTIAADDTNADYELEVFGSGPNVASSFDPLLQHELGEIIGLQAVMVGLPILWGPGLNTHRTPYNGRNGDYYSEDPVLSGVIAMEFSMGALDYGLIAAPKHFAFNDQETNRNGIAPFMTEQRAREIELRAFQIAVEATKYDDIHGKDVGMLGLMTSFSKIGPVEVNASYGLLTGILQKEWGFHGYSVTDISDDFDIYTALAYSGATGYDVRMGYEPSGFERYQSMADGIKPYPDLYKDDALLLNNFKTAARRTLWTFSQSNYMNNINSTSHIVWQLTWWRGVYIGLIAGFGALALAAISLYVLSTIKVRKDGVK